MLGQLLSEAIDPPGAEVREDDRYRFDPAGYFRDVLGWEPWSGTADRPGQQQILDAYVLALRQQLERRAFEQGKIARKELKYWAPGQTIRSVIRVEAGHTVGKTYLAAGIVSHFFDHFAPSVTYTYAPGYDQLKDLLWKNIAAQRADRNLPGRVLETCEIKDRPNHFVKGRATNDSHGRGTERVQGQHEEHQLFVLDEAEGVADFVYSAVRSMTSGGISVVVLLANPRTRTSLFHKMASRPNVANFRISCLHHPNVVQGRDVISGAVRRDYVEEMAADHAQVVGAHDPDEFTFEFPWRPGVIYLPDPEYMWRVLGVAPTSISDRNLVPVGRYEAALKRKPVPQNPDIAYVGVDVARFGRDFGTVYIRWNGTLWRVARLSKKDSVQYAQVIKSEALKLTAKGVKRVHFRVDGGGGFGGGVVDTLRRYDDLKKAFVELRFFECQFGGSPRNKKEFYDAITEWTADVAESLKGLALRDVPNELQEDLCERLYDYRNVGSDQVKKLEEKKEFRKRMHRSPDDGDGAVLAGVSEFLLDRYGQPLAPGGADRRSPWVAGRVIGGDDDEDEDYE